MALVPAERESNSVLSPKDVNSPPPRTHFWHTLQHVFKCSVFTHLLVRPERRKSGFAAYSELSCLFLDAQTKHLWHKPEEMAKSTRYVDISCSFAPTWSQKVSVLSSCDHNRQHQRSSHRNKRSKGPRIRGCTWPAIL